MVCTFAFAFIIISNLNLDIDYYKKGISIRENTQFAKTKRKTHNFSIPIHENTKFLIWE